MELKQVHDYVDSSSPKILIYYKNLLIFVYLQFYSKKYSIDKKALL